MQVPGHAIPLWPLSRSYLAPGLRIGAKQFTWGERTYLMGVINVTPDSFSGDGTAGDSRRAMQRLEACERAGVDIIDIGAESSRPDAQPLAAQAELDRLLPTLARLRRATTLPISVDTYHASVAGAAIDAGADMVNDISGFRADPAMANAVGTSGVPAVVMHNQRGRPYHDVVADVRGGFEASLAIAAAGGVPPTRLVLDPGFGFGWTPEQNLAMIRRLPELWDLGLPLLVGVSRKSTIGAVLQRPVDERTAGTAGAVAVAVAAGADVVRVHDVDVIRDVVKVVDAIVRERWTAGS